MHHGWLPFSFGNSTYAAQKSPWGALRLGGAELGAVSGCCPVRLGLKYCQSCPQIIFAARPAAIRWQQPASTPNLDNLQARCWFLAPLHHFSACTVSHCPPCISSHYRHGCSPVTQLQPSLLSLTMICSCSVLCGCSTPLYTTSP